MIVEKRPQFRNNRNCNFFNQKLQLQFHQLQIHNFNNKTIEEKLVITKLIEENLSIFN